MESSERSLGVIFQLTNVFLGMLNSPVWPTGFYYSLLQMSYWRGSQNSLFLPHISNIPSCNFEIHLIICLFSILIYFSNHILCIFSVYLYFIVFQLIRSSLVIVGVISDLVTGKSSGCPTEALCKLLDLFSAWRPTSTCTNTGFLALSLPIGFGHEEALGRDSQPGSWWGQEHPSLLLPCAVRCDLGCRPAAPSRQLLQALYPCDVGTISSLLEIL